MKLGAAIALAALALLMLVGSLRADVSGAPAVIAFVLVVVLPGLGSGLLLRSHFAQERRRGKRHARLRRESIEAELLKVASESGGRLTLAEFIAATAIDAASTQEALDSLHDQGLTDVELTDGGQIVHVFRNLLGAEDKDETRGVLDD